MKPSIDISSVILPTLHPFALTTANLPAMKDWYAKVLGTLEGRE